jgi:hypothetical protein
MSNGSAVVDKWIAALRSMKKEVRAEQLRDVVEEDLRRTIAAGTTPDGVPWPQRKQGGRALQNAGGALTVGVAGSTIIARVTGPTAIHNFGTSKDPRRQVLPSSVTPTLFSKLKLAAFDRIRAVLGVS